jgi:trk system potassium uptake protein TrkA
MYVIVVGAGKVGYHLTRTLLAEGHEITLIEKDSARAAELAADFGENIVVGDGCEVRVMQDVGMARADVVVAVTGHDEDNIIVCQMAQRQFHVPRQIARVNNPKNEPVFHDLGVTETVSSTRIIYSLIDQEVESGESLLLTALKRGKIVIVAVDLAAGSPGAGKMVKDIHLAGECVLAAIIRDEHILLPSGATQLESGDTVIAVSTPQDQHVLREALLESGASAARPASPQVPAASPPTRT